MNGTFISNFQPSSRKKKFQAISASPNRYFREKSRWVPLEQGLLSQLCCSLHSSQGQVYIPICYRLLFRFMVQRTRRINVDVLVLQRFVSFPELKNEAYTCVPSLFRRAFAPPALPCLFRLVALSVPVANQGPGD